MSGTNSIPEMPFRADCEEHAGLRGLDRRDALLALRVRTFVREELGVDWRGARLLLSLSGGIDSTALLCLLLALRPLENLTLAAAHLDHCLRPESGDDAAYVRALCAAWEIPLHERKEDIRARAQAGAIGEEEAGRTARRAFLAETASLIHADWVLLAHHADDLAEILNDILSESWGARYGIEISTFGVNSVKAPEEDEKMIKELQRNAAFRNPAMAAAQLVSAQSAAMQAAAANPNAGPMMAFAGMNMAGQAGGVNAQNLFAMAQQQAQQTAGQAGMAQQQVPGAGMAAGQMASAPQNGAGTWTCVCGTSGNTGKFCSECGKPRPSEDWVCTCGTRNKGKFCSECGKPRP